MRTILITGAAIAALAIGAFATGLPQAAAQQGERYAARGLQGAEHRGGPRGMRGDRRMNGYIRLRDQFDSNGDGAITQTEIDGTRDGQVTRFDTDGDGALSIEEYEALWLDAMRNRMIRRFQSHDRDGDGIVSAEEYRQRTRDLVLRHDRTGDGQLTIEDARRAGRSPRAQ
ncbi:MAG: hypothetical protein AAF675_20470 [Pseudomonadota bacterium]